MLWDTAGQEEFDAITKAYYRGAQACVLTFSTTDRASFEAVKDWKKKVENECGEVPTVLVQNKIDLMDQAVVSLWVYWVIFSNFQLIFCISITSAKNPSRSQRTSAFGFSEHQSKRTSMLRPFSVISRKVVTRSSSSTMKWCCQSARPQSVNLVRRFTQRRAGRSSWRDHSRSHRRRKTCWRSAEWFDLWNWVLLLLCLWLFSITFFY